MGVWLCLVNVLAQNTPSPPLERKSEPVLRQTPLDAIVLIDADKNRVLLPGNWSLTVLDDFLDYLLQGHQNQVPPFVLRNISATGTVVGHYVETNVKIELKTTTYQSVRVPLGFKEGILPSEDQAGQPPFLYSGTGSAQLTVDSHERQYVAIVSPRVHLTAESAESAPSEKPEIEQLHTLSLLLWVPLVQNASGENRLPISFPQSNSSLFLLEIPMSSVDASVTRGWILDHQENADQQSTLLNIQGLGLGTEIAWSKKKSDVADDRPVLHVDEATIDIRLNPRSVVYDVLLPVRTATASFDQLQIRLPHGCLLDREITDKYATAGNYSVGEVNAESIVTIQLPQTTGFVPLRLRGSQQFEGDGDKSDFKRELAGFEVLGAERQTGFLTVSVSPSEMKPHWEPVRGIRRIEGTSPGTISPVTSGEARFEFITQPFQLSVQVRSPQTRINVKPEYQFRVSKGMITMTARLSYTVSGPKTSVLYLRLSDSKWNCDFRASNLVNAAEFELDESGLLSIPLHSQTDGTFNIDFQASRLIASEGEQWHRIVLPMPEPQVQWSEPAHVVIVSENNVEVRPIDESYSVTAQHRTRGLTRQTRQTQQMQMRVDLTDLQQEPLFYRTDPTGAQFVADLLYHKRQISATMQTEVRLSEENNQIKQTISYEAKYAPAERLYFLLPKALETGGNIQVRWGNRTLELRDTIPDALDNVPDNWVRKSVQLPEPTFKTQLSFDYSTTPLKAPYETAPLLLSFVCPAEVTILDHLIHFYTPQGYKVELQNESRSYWEPYRESRRLSTEIAETYRSSQSPTRQSPTRIALFVSAVEQNISGTTLVERAWLQTWLTGDSRVDRATYILKSTDDFVTIQLPPDVLRDHRIIVRVDHRQIQANISPMGSLTIPILPEQHNRSIEIFVDYRFGYKIPPFEVPMVLPSFSKETPVQYLFWKIILPHGKHIIDVPTGWTQEYHWAWTGLFWGRVPSIQKDDLGLGTDEVAISDKNQYVFRHLQPPADITFYVVDRSLIVLCSSSVALLVGLVLIYVPQSRYTGSLFGLGVALIAVLFYQPALVLLMLQAAVFGVFLALGAGYVHRIFHREKQWIPPVSIFEERTHITPPYMTPVPQPVHEVVMDEESADREIEPAVKNGNNGLPPNGQS